MKLKYSLLALSALAFFACEPLEDAYETIDKTKQPVVKTLDDYVLTDADYSTISKLAEKLAGDNEADKAKAKAVATDNALNVFTPSDVYLPGILSNLLPSWGKGSSASMTFNHLLISPEVQEEYSSVATTYVNNDEYKAILGADSPILHFTPAHSPKVELPKILAAKYADAVEGDLAIIEYKYDSKEPVFIQGDTPIEEDFETQTDKTDISIEGWKQIQLKGTQTWQARSYSGLYAQMSAYKAGSEVDSWLIAPAFEVTSEDMYATFDLKFGNWKGEAFNFMISESHNGSDAIDPTQWTNINNTITIPEKPAGSYGEWENVGKSNLSQYKGKTIYLAFRYTGAEPGVTTTVQLNDVLVSASKLDETNEMPYNALYKFDGTSWKPFSKDNLAVITPANYNAMGKPGERDNFSSSVKPIDYLPTYFAVRDPYAQDGAKMTVLYKYYTGKTTVIMVDEYMATDGKWTNLEVRSNEKYVNIGSEWIFDPTIVKSFSKDNYQTLLDWVIENKPAYREQDPKKNSTEYWFGGSVYYQNFNLQFIKRSSNDPEKLVPTDESAAAVYLLKMVATGIDIVLMETCSDISSKDKNGLDQYIRMDCKVYDGKNWRYGMRFKVLGDNKYEFDGEPAIAAW